METKYTKTQFWIFIITLIYVILFGIYYLTIKNYEFLWYIVIMFFIIGFVSYLHFKFKFSTGVLIGASIWGLMHMAGGSVYIGGVKLYSYMLIHLYDSGIPGMVLFKYDQLAHFYCYVVVTLMVFYILKNYLKEDANWYAVSILLVFIGMGIGALNEILEFIPVVFFDSTGVGGYHNTLLDIVFNTLGAIVAVVILSIKGKLYK